MVSASECREFEKTHFATKRVQALAFTLAIAAMAVVGLLAALIPGSKASRVDPVSAIRSEM